MRLRVKLCLKSSNIISLNYNHAFSSAIYKLLQFGSPEFSSFLHDKGYKADGKNFKLFTFALRFKNIKVLKDVLFLENKNVDLFITSPLADEFVKNFVIGTFTAKQLELKANNTLTRFSIEQAELLSEPSLNSQTKFLMMSPMVLSKRTIYKGKEQEYYLRYNDDPDEINKIFNTNLASKYLALFNKEYTGDGLKLTWKDEYINNTLRSGRQIQKRVLITKDIDNPISIIGIEAPFKLEGDPKLMKVGYECGFGKSNSLGFGMAEVTN